MFIDLKHPHNYCRRSERDEAGEIRIKLGSAPNGGIKLLRLAAINISPQRGEESMMDCRDASPLNHKEENDLAPASISISLMAGDEA